MGEGKGRVKGKGKVKRRGGILLHKIPDPPLSADIVVVKATTTTISSILSGNTAALQ